MPRPILVVMAPAAISIPAVITPTAAYRTAVRVHIAVHPVHHSARVVLAHTSHPVAVALTGSPITTDLTVLTPIPVFHSRLLGLLGAALRLYGNTLGLAGILSRTGAIEEVKKVAVPVDLLQRRGRDLGAARAMLLDWSGAPQPDGRGEGQKAAIGAARMWPV
jgi:hypothetical protein